MNARIRSINAEQGYSHREILIVGNSNKLVYLTARITALSRTKLKDKFTLLHMYAGNFQKKKSQIALLQGF